MARVHVSYYTDPACPWSWSLEPVVRRLGADFGEELSFAYVMGGLARQFERASEVAATWLDAAETGDMPVDPRLWLRSPPASSYPACLAVKAAAEQGDPAAYLRRLREGFALRRRKLDNADALLAEARETPGLDAQRFAIDLRSNAMAEALGADLDRAEAVDPTHRGPEGRRVRLPSLEFRGADGEVHGVYGPADYAAYRDAARAAGAVAHDRPPPSPEDALRRFGAMATAEVAAVCDLAGPRAAAELWRLAGEWRVRPERLGLGELWTSA